MRPRWGRSGCSTTRRYIPDPVPRPVPPAAAGANPVLIGGFDGGWRAVGPATDPICSDCCPGPWHRPSTAIQEDQIKVGKSLATPIRGLVDRARYPAPDASPLAAQALDIIWSILEDPSPGLADIKLRLRRCLAAYPRHPELALLAHLMETSSMVNPNGGETLP